MTNPNITACVQGHRGGRHGAAAQRGGQQGHAEEVTLRLRPKGKKVQGEGE